MTDPNEPLPFRTDEVTEDGVFQVVAEGYEAVYAALAKGETFNRLWRTWAYRDEFSVDFAHIGFLTSSEASRVFDELGLNAASTLVDLACGGGGPGLWMAQESGASLIGVDPTAAGLAIARERARHVGLDQRTEFALGSFEHTGLTQAVADAVMTIESFHYAPDKGTGLAEMHRILQPGGRVVVVAFEVDPIKVKGVPVLGVDPVDDYRPLFEAAGFEVIAYEETPGWEERVYGAFQAIVDAANILADEMGEHAAAGVITEATVTLSLRPYPRRILATASAR
jgi:SAM-dependent methyltransferase